MAHGATSSFKNAKQATHLRLLVDPVESSLLPALELVGLEPQGNLLLGVLDAVGAVADVAADVLGDGCVSRHVCSRRR